MKTKKIIIGLGILCLNAVAYAQGLEGIVVEKYYLTNAADGANALENEAITTLNTGTTVYRVFVDMAAGYKYSQIFGSNANNLKVNTTTNFYNDPSYGVSINPATNSLTRTKQKTVMIDSWFTTGGTAAGKVGVLKSEDTDGALVNAQGILANNAGGCFGLPINGLGAQDGFVASSTSTYVVPNPLGLGTSLDCLEGTTPGNSILITNGAIAALGGIVGATSSNMVLIGQFTTDGVFTFELNLQLVNIATGLAENYVASNPTGSQLTHPTLTRGSNLAPAVLCYQTATFNNQTCTYDITGPQPVEPTTALACYQTRTFNGAVGVCAWEVSGTQPTEPTTALACYQTRTFNGAVGVCAWEVSGTQQINATSISACGSFNWGNNGQIYTASGTYFGNTVNCIIQKLILTITTVSSAEISYVNSSFCNAETNLQLVSLVGSSGGIYGAIPAGLSLDLNSGSITPSASSPGNYIVTYTTQASGSCNSVSDSAYIIISEVPDEPTGLACWQSADLISSSCSWAISGTQPVQPLLACYETAVFNTTSCSWVVSGTQAAQPTGLSCWQTAVFNTTSCSWDVSGTQAAQPTNLSCWQTATFNTTSCSWVVSGTQAAQPTNLSCWQTAAFNTTSCSWDVSGTQAQEPTGLSCWQTATFNTTSCSWDVSGTQALEPTGLSCWQTAAFNTTSCAWDVTGTQAQEPTGLSCWQTAIFNTTTCAWVVSGTQAQEPTGLSCWQTAAFNTTSCAWDVTGTQAQEPTGLSCWQMAAFNTTTCSWDISGSQPVQPTLDFCETTLFNIDSCAWIISSTIQENTVNTDTISPYLWLVNGQTYTFSGTYEFLDTINCVLEILNLALTNSISEELTNNLTLYPNPTNGTIVISLPNNDQYTLNVYDSQGKLVFENTAYSNSIVHDLSSYRPGLYTIKVILSDFIYTERVIKN